MLRTEGQALSGGGDGAMCLWDLSTGKKAGVFTCHITGIDAAAVNSVTYSAQAKLAATAGECQPILLWNLETGKEVLRIVTGVDREFVCVCFSPDGKRLAGCYGGRLRIWEVETGNELLRIDPRLSPDSKYEERACCVAFSPDGKRIVSGGDHHDTTVRVWDATTGRELHKYEGHTQVVGCVTFFPDGKRIASAGYDGTARIWRAPR